MSYKTFWFSILFIISALYCNSQVVIRGTIYDTLNGKVILYEPIDGFYNDDIADSVFEIHLNKDHQFEKTIDIKYPTQIFLQAGFGGSKFIAFPHDTIDVTIDVQKQNDSVSNAVIFKGKNKAGHELFLSCFPPIGIYMDFENDLEKVHFFGQPRRIELFDSVLKTQTRNFDRLLKRHEITSEYHQLVTTLLQNFLIGHFISKIIYSKKYTFNEKMDVIGKFYNAYKLKDSDPLLSNSFFSLFIYDWQFGYQQALKDGKIDRFSDKLLAVKGKEYLLNGNLSFLQYAPKHLQEGLWATTLIRYKQLFGGKYDQKDVDTYLAVFPNSPFKKYLKPPFYGFLPWAKEDSAKAKFITLLPKDNLDSIISKQFKGENFLIDMWATWCTPCKEEFRYIQDVDKFCNENNIKRLYISLDKMDDKEAMIKDIYAYHLEGTHTTMNYALQQDIVKRVYDGKVDNLTIPRYILINAKGEIVDKNLIRPSREKLFYKKISELLFTKIP